VPPPERRYAKRPFAGPEAVLAYLSRYTHRVAISNRRLVAMDERGVTFRRKDYRDKDTLHMTMTHSVGEFMRRSGDNLGWPSRHTSVSAVLEAIR
jgi:hypothetical protein